MILFALSGLFITIALVISLYNSITAPILKSGNNIISLSYFISVLIPVRNEELNIIECASSILNQKYKNFELLILNDNSSDNTRNLVKSLEKKDSRVKLIEGLPLPANWTGKNWACHQLAQISKGELLLFVDADVRFSEDTLAAAVKEFEEKKVKMLTVFPTQNIRSFGEALIVPLMNWLLLSFLPLIKVYNSVNSSFIAANGQFILFERDAYFETGGHEKLSSHIVEDMELARLFKSKGYKIITFLGGKLLYCRMYNSFSSSLNGFVKNFYPGFNTSIFSFFMMIIILSVSFIYPFIAVFSDKSFLILISMIIFERMLISYGSSQNIVVNIVLHPLQIMFMFYIGIISVLKSHRKEISWKGRNLLRATE